MYNMEGSIIKDPLPLSCDMVPSRIYCRDDQLSAIKGNLAPLVNGSSPRSMFIFGPPGSGKTSISKYVLGELSESSESPVKTVYVNCWENSSRFKILYAISEKLGMVLSVHRKGMPTDELLEVMQKKMEGRKAVVVLDEVDQLEDGKVLYDMMLVPGICLVMIANDEDVFSRLDPRIMSRLATMDRIEFPRYTPSDIAGILKDRVEWSLVPGAIKKVQLEKIAKSSAGDARVAINLLRIIAESAEHDDMSQISDYYVDKVMQGSMAKIREKAALGLNQYQQIVLDLLRKNKSMESGALFSQLCEIAAEKKLEPVVDRTFRNYMDRLSSGNFVRASGEGRWRVFSIV